VRPDIAKGVKTLDDFNAFMRDISKDVVETLLEGELTDHLGYEKHDQKAKETENARGPHPLKLIQPEMKFLALHPFLENSNELLRSQVPQGAMRPELVVVPAPLLNLFFRVFHR